MNSGTITSGISGTVTSRMSGTVTPGIGGTVSPEYALILNNGIKLKN
jgi:hypothetical protein